MSNTESIYDIIKKDHKEISDLFKDLFAAETQEEKEDIYHNIRHLLTLHSASEEASFYHRLAKEEKLNSKVKHARKEHAELKKFLLKSTVIPTEFKKWEETMKKFENAFLAHIAEEEDIIFPIAQEILSKEEEKQLGLEIKTLKSSTAKLLWKKALDLFHAS